MTGAVDEEESSASVCGSLWEPREDVGAKPEQLSVMRRFLKRFLKRRDAPKNLQPSSESEPEDTGMNEKCRSFQSSYDSQSSDQSNQLRPNFSADPELLSTKNRMQELEEDY